MSRAYATAQIQIGTSIAKERKDRRNARDYYAY